MPVKKTKKSKWEDVSSYSRGDTARVPHEFQLDLISPPLRLTVHRYHGEPDVWFLSCRELRYVDKKRLESKDIESAKREALVYLTDLVGKIHAALTKVLG